MYLDMRRANPSFDCLGMALLMHAALCAVPIPARPGAWDHAQFSAISRKLLIEGVLLIRQ